MYVCIKHKLLLHQLRNSARVGTQIAKLTSLNALLKFLHSFINEV